MSDPLTDFAMQFRLTKEELQKLMRACSTEELYNCLELLKPLKHRSGFRSGLAVQIRRWLVDPKAVKPLSPRQFKASVPKWPLKYQIPNESMEMQPR
jgi:hypothetical protein